MLGSIKIVREFVNVKDRCARDDAFKGFDHFCYYTKVVDTSIEDPVATLGLVHGFIQNQNNCYFESAIHHALNGFEVHMIDLRGYGCSSSVRCKDFNLYDSHEHIGMMINKFRDDKPAFIIGHSMGCKITQTFLIRNPDVNLAGVIYAAPFFRFAASI